VIERADAAWAARVTREALRVGSALARARHASEAGAADRARAAVAAASRAVRRLARQVERLRHTPEVRAALLDAVAALEARLRALHA
jgi:hypothetical protein